MDFNQLDSRAAADESRPHHIKHPVTGEPLYDNPKGITEPNKKPCRVWIRGSEGREAQRALRDVLRSETKDAPPPDELESAEYHHERLVKLTAPLITKFENVKRGGKVASVPDDVEWFLNLQLQTGRKNEKSFAEQVSEFAVQRGNYLGNSGGVS